MAARIHLKKHKNIHARRKSHGRAKHEVRTAMGAASPKPPASTKHGAPEAPTPTESAPTVAEPGGADARASVTSPEAITLRSMEAVPASDPPPIWSGMRPPFVLGSSRRLAWLAVFALAVVLGLAFCHGLEQRRPGELDSPDAGDVDEPDTGLNTEGAWA